MNTTAPAPAPVKARPGVRPGTRPGVRSDIRPARTPAVEVRGLTKTFGPVTAVDRLDLTVAPGEVVAFRHRALHGGSHFVDRDWKSVV